MSRLSLAMLCGFGFLLAACNTPPPSPSATPAAAVPYGVPTAGTGVINPIEGRRMQDPVPGVGSPTAGTGVINPIEGRRMQDPVPGVGMPTAGSGLINPVEGRKMNPNVP